jgi:formate dehydrogenase
MYAGGLMDALGTRHYYTPNTQDTASRFAATGLMYGSILSVTIPDLYRTRFLLMVGANPLVSHGSLVAGRQLGATLRAIPERGGRVVVVDPVRTKTARAFEHVPIIPDSDAWMALSMLHVIFAEGLEDRAFLARHASGVEGLAAMAAPHGPEATEDRTGIPAAELRQLARDFATAESATVYARIGTNRGRHATLTAFLLDSLNVVTGNLDRPGGALFGMFATPAAANKRIDAYDSRRTRVGNFPDTFGMMASAVMAKEMTQPGPGQLRAFLAIGGNPILSSPNGAELGAAMEGLDLAVAIELYASETAQYCDYILPATTFYEREDVNLVTAHFNLSPHLEWTDPVIAPRGEARQEWEILDAIARQIGVVPASEPAMRLLGRLGFRPSPEQQIDAALRLGQFGDWFGLRRKGLNLRKLKASPHGVVLREHVRTGVLRKKVRHRDGRVDLAPAAIVDEARRLGLRHREDPDYPLSMISLRELRSHNSWMHNVPKLRAADHEMRARVHPDDAAAAGIAEGDLVRITSATGSIEVPATLTDAIVPGAIAVPHGWGHDRGAGWRVAGARPGVNVNLLASTELGDIEPLAGMTLLDGIPVRIEPADRPVPA